MPNEESRLILPAVGRPFVDEVGPVLSARRCRGATVATAAGADDAVADDVVDADADAGEVTLRGLSDVVGVGAGSS